jgi:hypothetical protein
MLLMMTMVERDTQREREREKEEEERGVHEKITCFFMPIAETKAETILGMLLMQLV